MTKEAIRKIYKAKRNELSGSQKTKFEDLILIQFQKLNIEIPSLIMTYAPIEKLNEFDPQLITDYCFFKNPYQVLFYPVTHPTAISMVGVVVNDETEFKIGKMGVPEPVCREPIFPESIDLILVPLLAFDLKGQRVGYGKGYYDRYLKDCKNAVKIGFSFFDPEKQIDDCNKNDVKLDYCVTPLKTYQFKK